MRKIPTLIPRFFFTVQERTRTPYSQSTLIHLSIKACEFVPGVLWVFPSLFVAAMDELIGQVQVPKSGGLGSAPFMVHPLKDPFRFSPGIMGGSSVHPMTFD